MSERTLLVLGASPHQLDVIAHAQRRGLTVAVADNVPDNPGHRLADVSHVVDTTDVDAIEAVARDEHAAGIVAACTDVAVPTAAIVAARLGLPGIDPATAALVTSKLAFRRWQREHGLPSPHALPLDGAPLGDGRWIVKPDRSSGSKGVRIVEDGAQAAEAAHGAREHSGAVVAEAVVEGHHVTVEGVLSGGRLAWSVVLDRQTAQPPLTATTGHRVPTVLDDGAAAAAVAAVERTLRELGLQEGPVDADVVVGDEVVVLELSPRLGGNSIAELLRLATGVDLAAAAVDVALGLPCQVPASSSPRPAAVVLLGADREGELAYDAGAVEELRAEPWVAGLELQAQGTAVRPFADGRAVVGRAFVTAADRAEVDERADAVRERLGVHAR